LSIIIPEKGSTFFHPQVDIMKDEGEGFGFSHRHGKVQFNRARGAHGTGEGFWAPRGTAYLAVAVGCFKPEIWGNPR